MAHDAGQAASHYCYNMNYETKTACEKKQLGNGWLPASFNNVGLNGDRQQCLTSLKETITEY